MLMFTKQKVPVVNLKFVCHFLNIATPEHEEANGTLNACEEEDDQLSVLLAAMSSCSSEEIDEDVTPDDSNTELSDDEEHYQELEHGVDSIVLPVAIQELILFPALTLVCLMNYPVFVKDVANAICIAEFGYRLFAVMNSNIKKRLCKAISDISMVIQPHPSQYAFCKGKCTVSMSTLVTGLQVAGIKFVTLVAYGMKMNYSDCLF